jgi:hypothetical protein
MKHLLFIFLFICPLILPGQKTEKLHQITKRLEKSFAYNKNYEVNIEGEKADVVIETWNKPEISITLELTARHPEKEVAEKDIEKIKYLAERVRNKIYIRNYISVKEGEAKPESNLQARYVILVPEECPVYLKNYFGVANVSNLSNRFRFFGEFTKIGMQNVQGNIDLRSRFGDIDGKTLKGDVSISARRSDVILEDIHGNYNIESQYGMVSVLSVGELLSLNIDAEKSDVHLYDPRLRQYGFTLNATSGKVNLPSDLKMELLANTDDLKKMSFKPVQEFYPSITISVAFGDVYIDKEKPSSMVRP